MKITGLGGRIPASQAELYIGNAGTAARFLSAFLTLGDGEYRLDGDPRMRQRPIGDLIDALSQLGAKIESSGGCPPVTVSGAGLPGGKTQVSGNISSQYISALLMAAPYAKSPVEIKVITELVSRPYVEMTIRIMAEFNLRVDRKDEGTFTIQPAVYSRQESYTIESDASAASYFFAAPAVCGGTVQVENISRTSLQGDIAFLEVLAQMGCTITETDSGISVTGAAKLDGIEVDMRDIPDTAQTLAAIAPFAAAPTRIQGIASARVKETDRVSATCRELARLGVRVEEYHDGMTIYPCTQIQPAVIHTYNDHRMAMAFSLIGLRSPGIRIENPDCVSKTFPNYFEVLEKLR
ncbi:MAG: 3-phosphoshikimate 1-carboxyvinyltransferase [Akkermansiaceae bacterium]|nr:3-phosphoshikimate 1-carboxyvinyltransferase [Xanthomonadales bacterium]NIP92742.1 3-phosphoshikimate 1-carboxyvinyltransferase [Akkermansiaceae bacterium]NIX12890.1 3-phosphoshikimate 1-carboxyvinyltransferase [Xanthomonadales bacterium]